VRLKIRRSKFLTQNAHDFTKQIALRFRREQPIDRRRFFHPWRDALRRAQLFLGTAPRAVDLTRRSFPWPRLGVDVDGDHEAVGPFEFERFVAGAISLDVVRHHDEAVISWRAPILQIFHHNRIVGHSFEFIENNFTRFAIRQFSFGVIARRVPTHWRVRRH